MFAIFDPVRILGFSLNWCSSFLVLIFFFDGVSIKNTIIRKLQRLMLKTILGEFKPIFSILRYPGSLVLCVRLFILVVANNVLGLFPYIFTASRHGLFTVTFALPLWVGHIIWAFIFNFERTLAHFLPLNTPAALAPLIVLIEVIRNAIRPLTLSIRLAANIIAGHLLLGLLRENMVNGISVAFFFTLIGLMGLIVLELAVALIQGYVFSLLITLYLNDVNTKKFFRR